MTGRTTDGHSHDLIKTPWDALLTAYRSGQPDAVQRCLVVLKDAIPAIIGWVDSSLTPQDRDELAGRLLHKLHAERKLLGYRGPSTFLGWLKTVVVRERADFFRERQKDSILTSLDEEDASDPSTDGGVDLAPSTRASPTENAANREISAAISVALGGLKESDRSILTMRLVDDMTYEQIAAVLSIKASDAHLRFWRARRKLAEILARQGIVPDGWRQIPVKEQVGEGVSS